MSSAIRERSGSSMPVEVPSPPYRVLVIADDYGLIEDLERHLAVRPLHVYFTEPGPGARVILERSGVRFLAFARSITQRTIIAAAGAERYEILTLGAVEDGMPACLHGVREALIAAGAQPNLGIGVVGLEREHHAAARRFLRESAFELAVAYSREEALDADLISAADVVLFDSKLGEIDQWSFVHEILQSDRGSGLPVYGIVPRIDADVLKQTVQHSMAGFLLRSMIDERLYPRFEGVARSGKRRRPEPPAADPRYRQLEPDASEEQARLFDDEIAVDLGKRIMKEITQRPGFEDERAQSLIGKNFGKVCLVNVIGRGGSGTVYRARHRTLDTIVAVKILFAEDVARDQRFAHRFIEEARIAANIEHPNMVRVIDFDRDDSSGCYYLVMELVQGVSLLQMLRSRGPRDEMELLDIAERVSDVLALAAERGIVHRDITPANILLTQRGMVKLTDLGIAKFVAPPQGGVLAGSEMEQRTLDERLMAGVGVPVRTATGVIMGTPHYISPEQSRDARHVDPRADMYSLGATLFHAATGQPPYTGVTIVDLVVAHREAEIPDPRSINEKLSPHFAALIKRLLQKKPEHRFPSYDRLIGAIREVRHALVERQVLAEIASRGPLGQLARWFAPRRRPPRPF